MNLTVPRRFLFVDHLCYFVLCLSCFRAYSLLPCGQLKRRADLLALFVMFIVIWLFSHLESWERCGT